MQVSAPTYHVSTWGCQMNEEDSEQIGLFFDMAGFLPASAAEDADVVVLNTCSVRRKPEEKVYSRLGELREIKRERPDMVIAVCGCMAQVEAEQISRRAPYVDIVAGPGHNAALPDLARRVLDQRSTPDAERSRATVLDQPLRKGATVSDVPLRALARRSALRAFVPVMYGCDRFCTFCIVPLARGRERSRPPDEVVSEVRRLAASGSREVTLLGQTVNSYGRNLPDRRTTFAELLTAVAAVPGIERVRFTSPHPLGFSQELIDVIAHTPEVCEHAHLPLQAGDDTLLRRMKRGYTVARYVDLVEQLRAAVPGIAITTDIMLGFPGETEEQFEATMGVVERIRFDAAFMFAYSPRRGTRAAEMPDQVPQPEKIRRLKQLIELQSRITTERNASEVGSVHQVLVEGVSPRNRRRLTGLTRTFKTASIDIAPGQKVPAAGDLIDVIVTEGLLTGFICSRRILRQEEDLAKTHGHNE